MPVPEKRIDIVQEIPPEYYIKEKGIILFQAGKIQAYGQGCNGPIEKVVRDFMVRGDWVSLIDMKAGIEYFGRKIPDTMDIILTILDPTLESVSIAKRIEGFCRETKMKNFWFILNNINSKETESMIMEKLGGLKTKVLGSVSHDPEVVKMGLEGGCLVHCKAEKDVKQIENRLGKKSLRR